MAAGPEIDDSAGDSGCTEVEEDDGAEPRVNLRGEGAIEEVEAFVGVLGSISVLQRLAG